MWYNANYENYGWESSPTSKLRDYIRSNSSMIHSKYWVWLSAIPKIGPRKCLQLLENFNSPDNVWHASKSELEKMQFLNEEAISHILNSKYKEVVYKHLENIEKHKIQIITINDDAYPFYLKNIHDPPVVLYVRGKLIKGEKFISVIGSRKATAYGLNIATTISSELARLGITVISGFARGIDSCAHNASLNVGGRTVAVLGCGPDIIYPSENKNLMDKIINSGAVVSEFVPGTPPLAQNFPARNRIISGASVGVVVVEAGEKSGTLITSYFALEQGREVFAVPGNITSLNSKGTNRLIKDGAKIVTCIEDILEELNVPLQTNNIYCNQKKALRKIDYERLESEEVDIVKQLEMEPLHIDLLAKKCGFSMHIINSILVLLEMKGIIEQLPGKVFRIKEW